MNRWRLLSPPGVSAVTVIALAGDLSRLEIRGAGPGIGDGWPAAGQVRLRLLCTADGVVDEALVVGTCGGAELHLHGGSGVLKAVEAWLAVGGFHRAGSRTGPQPSSLRHARTLLSAEVGPLARLRRLAEHGTLQPGPEHEADFERCFAQRAVAERMRCMPVIALAGLPNAGKSTLFNAMVGSERALVSPQPGTTRDTVRAVLQLHGLAVELRDTAGALSAEGGCREADVVVHLLSEPGEVPWQGHEGQLVMPVLGQCDRRSQESPRDVSGRGVSGKTGEGVSQLLSALATLLQLGEAGPEDQWVPAHPAFAHWLASSASSSSPASDRDRERHQA
jgi:hypothetical protein